MGNYGLSFVHFLLNVFGRSLGYAGTTRLRGQLHFIGNGLRIMLVIRRCDPDNYSLIFQCPNGINK
jgi:hypothetical protein